jgi:hypothetical protein
MRSLISFLQEVFKLALSGPVTPTPQFIGPRNPKEIEQSLVVIEKSSPGRGPSRGPRDWLKVQLERLKRFLVKLLRADNYRW